MSISPRLSTPGLTSPSTPPALRPTGSLLPRRRNGPAHIPQEVVASPQAPSTRRGLPPMVLSAGTLAAVVRRLAQQGHRFARTVCRHRPASGEKLEILSSSAAVYTERGRLDPSSEPSSLHLLRKSTALHRGSRRNRCRHIPVPVALRWRVAHHDGGRRSRRQRFQRTAPPPHACRAFHHARAHIVNHPAIGDGHMAGIGTFVDQHDTILPELAVRPCDSPT